MKKVDELLTQSEKYLEEMKMNIADIRKEITEFKRERAEKQECCQRR
jgi:septal ring factor EnvC (AmiA/AmiB activator)